MHASYEDFCNTPVDIIMQDLEFYRHEKQVEKAKNEQDMNSRK